MGSTVSPSPGSIAVGPRGGPTKPAGSNEGDESMDSTVTPSPGSIAVGPR